MVGEAERNFRTNVPYLIEMYSTIMKVVANNPTQALILGELLISRKTIFKDLSPVPGEGDIAYRLQRLVYFGYLEINSNQEIVLTQPELEVV
jgi:hypothetical protein